MKRSHNDALVAVGTTLRATTDRIIRTWNRATDADKVNGAQWYDEAMMLVKDLASVPGWTGTQWTHEHVAAVIAHLSPRTRWSRNVYGATMLLTTGEAPECIVANVIRAGEAMMSDDPLSTLKGPKTRRFALNILGDTESVTVDMWAAIVALGTEDYEPLIRRAGVYDAIERAYQLAARRHGVAPSVMQATTWIVARNGRWQ